MIYKKWAIALAAWGMTSAAVAVGGEIPTDLLGSAVPASESERRILIDPDTCWANVKQGETIQFVVGAQSFAWRFNGLPRSFDLMRVAPAGVLNRPLTVYVMPKIDPRRE